MRKDGYFIGSPETRALREAKYQAKKEGTGCQEKGYETNEKIGRKGIRMSLEERLVKEMKEAMKSNDKLRLSTIRMIRSTVKNKEIEIRKPLDDGEIQRVIQGMVRRG